MTRERYARVTPALGDALHVHVRDLGRAGADFDLGARLRRSTVAYVMNLVGLEEAAHRLLQLVLLEAMFLGLFLLRKC